MSKVVKGRNLVQLFPFISIVSGVVYIVAIISQAFDNKISYHLDVNEWLSVSQSFLGIVSHKDTGVVHCILS